MKQVICIKSDGKDDYIRYTEPVPDEINPITGAMAKAGDLKPKVFDSIVWERNMKHCAAEYGLEVVSEKYVKPQDKANDIVTVQVVDVDITSETVKTAPTPHHIDIGEMSVRKVIEHVKAVEMTEALRRVLKADGRVTVRNLAK